MQWRPSGNAITGQATIPGFGSYVLLQEGLSSIRAISTDRAHNPRCQRGPVHLQSISGPFREDRSFSLDLEFAFTGPRTALVQVSSTGRRRNK